ncbi:Putative adhesin [Seinonella peptonophila]|uniref:Putative adhesin n=1 Tax=Seinonella peptonophila TaxID=112248 RepID=A0A1M4U8Y4_9BACL|nr:DUF4097 family beta strand repeat-containing protein [Seinonella peptonophila]SHE53185.1 Putative adhesin [Seinonella peptonophila]
MSNVIKVGLALLIVGMIGTVVILSQGAAPLLKRIKADAKPIHIQKISNGKETKNIKINSELSDIQILESNSDQVKMELKGSIMKKDQVDLITLSEGENLVVQVDYTEDKGLKFDFGVNQNLELKVFLPKKAFETVRLQTVNGEIKSDLLLQANQIEIETTNGALALSNLQAKKIEGTSQNGDIGFKQVKAESLNMQTVNGEIHLQDYQGHQVTGQSSSGAININKVDATLDLESTNGTIQVDQLTQFKGKNSVQSTNGDITIGAITPPTVLQVSLDSLVGNIKSVYPISSTQITNSEDAPSHSIKGSIGQVKPDSPSLDVITTNGDIRLK